MDKTKSKVTYFTVSSEVEGQRIDNFLLASFKNMPKSHVYRMVRKGEVRVNKKRISPCYRLKEGDSVRFPPVYLPEKAVLIPPGKQSTERLADCILYEDENLLVINKPSGMAVHVGSTIKVGVIEALRHMYPQFKHLELAHRLDTETSGCLILGKKKKVLRELHALLREGLITKIYWALTKGKWKDSELRVEQPLHKDYRDGGKHVVSVRRDGKPALSVFHTLQKFCGASLVEVKLFTGRTHQIRVHAQYQGHPIAGDDRYGDTEFNKLVRQQGLKRMFLHARSVEFTLPSSSQRIKVVAPLDPALETCIQAFELIENKRGHDER